MKKTWKFKAGDIVVINVQKEHTAGNVRIGDIGVVCNHDTVRHWVLTGSSADVFREDELEYLDHIEGFTPEVESSWASNESHDRHCRRVLAKREVYKPLPKSQSKFKVGDKVEVGAMSGVVCDTFLDGRVRVKFTDDFENLYNPGDVKLMPQPKFKVGDLVQSNAQFPFRGKIIDSVNDYLVEDSKGNRELIAPENLSLAPVFKVGDWVRSKNTGNTGRIISLDTGDSFPQVEDVEGRRLHFFVDEMEHIPAPTPEQPKTETPTPEYRSAYIKAMFGIFTIDGHKVRISGLDQDGNTKAVCAECGHEVKLTIKQ